MALEIPQENVQYGKAQDIFSYKPCLSRISAAVKLRPLSYEDVGIFYKKNNRFPVAGRFFLKTTDLKNTLKFSKLQKSLFTQKKSSWEKVLKN